MCYSGLEMQLQMNLRRKKMINVEEIQQKLLQQFKTNHQKSISEDSLCSKLIRNYEDIDAEEVEQVKAFLIANGITITDTISDIPVDDKEFENIISQINVNDPVKMYLKEIGSIPLQFAKGVAFYLVL